MSARQKNRGASPKAKQLSRDLFLPICAEDIRRRGWEAPDIVIVTGDAYIDHPTFGVALIGRWLEHLGYKVAVLSQPDWKSADAFCEIGRPRLFWAITSGAVDSRLNDYASMGHKRKRDVYSPEGETGRRPVKPLLTYSARAREAYKDVPIVLGGLEASLRRMAHYDYVEDKIKRSVLVDAKADILVHGMGELAIAEIAKRLDEGASTRELTGIDGTAVVIRKDMPLPERYAEIASLADIEADEKLFMQAHLDYEKQCMPGALPVLQDQGAGRVLMEPPARPLSTAEMDELYALTFTREVHPDFTKQGEVPALEPVKFSVTTHRGCFGGCSFCSIYFHQGKEISSRSVQSVMDEIEMLSSRPDFKGTIQDFGGPTANMYGMSCGRKKICARQSCLYPSKCPQLKTDYTKMLELMDKVAKWKRQDKGRKAFIASGVRYDLANESDEYIRKLAAEFTGGHLKVAPEHYSDKVLSFMRKPGYSEFVRFEEKFVRESAKAGKEQYLVPYFISAHPGCSPDEAIELTEYLVSRGWMPQQVQDFTPSPLSLSTAMYVSGLDAAGNKLFVPKGHAAKKLQAALLQYYRPENMSLISPLLSSKRKMKLLGDIERIVNYRKRRKR
ncbi:MAG: YgiQ family radical SAM protein [Phycisphaerae bacterium]